MRDHLSEALDQAMRAYQFAPGSYTFDAMAALWHAIKARDALQANWITEFIEYANNGDEQ
jgi:hypothetical protein